MKKMITILVLGVMMLTASLPMLYSAPDPEPEYETITMSEINGQYEILGVTQDGHLIIRYKGKIYILLLDKK